LIVAAALNSANKRASRVAAKVLWDDRVRDLSDSLSRNVVPCSTEIAADITAGPGVSWSGRGGALTAISAALTGDEINVKA
jgi:hypothetical protein